MRHAICLVLILVSGALAVGHPGRSLAEEQPIYSPRESLAWPRTVDPRHASQLPLSAFDARLATRVYLVREETSVAVYDPRSNQVYSGGQARNIGAASLSKVLIAIVALQQLEQQGADEDEILGTSSLIYPMIAYSDNDIANEVWELIGGQEGVEAFTAEYCLTGFAVPDPWDWGQVSASARDWAILFAMFGSGRILSADNTATLLSMMDSVIEEHRWGVLTRRNDRISFGKNGWYMDEDDAFDWRVNSAGFVSVTEPNSTMTPRVVVVLTRYPGEEGMSYGVELATSITDEVVACTHIQQERSNRREAVSSCTSDRDIVQMDVIRRIW